MKKEQKEAEIKLAQAKEEEEARAKIIEAEAAEAKKQVKVAALADKMAKFGINVGSPSSSDKK